MNPVLMFEDRVSFASFMVKHLQQSMGVKVEQDVLDPLRLSIQLDKSKPDRQIISLQNAYDEYRYYGDLNAAVHYLNMLTAAYRHVKDMDKPMAIRVDKLIPVLRSQDYVEGMQREGNEILHYDSYEGLRVILLEVHDGYSAIVNQDMLQQLRGWTPEKLLNKAVSNLMRKGWKNPSGMLVGNDPARGGLMFEADHSNYQFMLPQYRKAYLHSDYYIAFPNKGTTLVFINTQPMETVEEAQAVVSDSQINKVVEGLFRGQPHPLSGNVYWVKDGASHLVSCPRKR